jgi:hypothetical protein
LFCTHLEELGTLLSVTWSRDYVSHLFGFFRRFKFGFAHVDGSEETEGIEARHSAWGVLMEMVDTGLRDV